MAKPDDLERLKALDEKIAKAKDALNPPRANQDHHSMAQVGWRMVIELVAGLGVGAAIGYGLDVVFGTLPLLLVIFTLLGFAAGVQTMMRSARELAPKVQDGAPADTRAKEKDTTGG